MVLNLQIEPKQRIDNTALNAIKLICEDGYGNNTGNVTSTEGPWGSWVGPIKCKYDYHLTSFDLQVEEYRVLFSKIHRNDRLLEAIDFKLFLLHVSSFLFFYFKGLIHRNFKS